ncbi:translational GTPase TypA [Planctomycetota bacterium]
MAERYRSEIRNLAIIAHVDHGKTTLIDALLRQAGVLTGAAAETDCVMDSNDLERERGITIFSKCASFNWDGMQYNIIDTPGHADFGSEVERILKMVDGALLLVDAFEGPMPQTKFVLRKSLELGLSLIVVINKMDRPDARPDEVADLTFELFSELGATDNQIDFPIVYCSGKEGYARRAVADQDPGMHALLEVIRSHVPAPVADDEAPLQMLITMLDYDSYVGRIALGRVQNGRLRAGANYAQVLESEVISTERVTKLMSFKGLDRIKIDEARAGDVVAIAGFKAARVGATIAALHDPQALPTLKIDAPTISMNFAPNTSPLAGRDGARFLTSRQIRERLLREAEVNVGLNVEPLMNSERLKVSGRGELHLSILIETMRREGYEFEVSRPEVIFRTDNGKKQEPIEHLIVDLETAYQGAVMEELGRRKAEVLEITSSPGGLSTLMVFNVPSRSLLGFRSLFLTMTRGTGIMNHAISHYGAFKGEIPKRQVGVQISLSGGQSVAYALHGLQERGPLLIGAGADLYEGMIVGITNKGHDMTVNAAKQKKHTNVRASGTDEALQLVAHKVMTMEKALNFIEDDELVEITPKKIRLRKKIRSESDRRRHYRLGN